MSAFRMFKARGQPGHWYGYVEIEGHTYKIDARHVGERQAKHFEGTVERHVKADQQKLPLGTPGRIKPTTLPLAAQEAIQSSAEAAERAARMHEQQWTATELAKANGDFDDDEIPPF